MRRRFAAAVAALAAAAPLAAQNPQCASLTSSTGARQSCDAAVDFVRAYHPLAGLAVSGGNPVLGAGGAAGRLGSFSITLRANAFHLSVPDLSNVSATGQVPEDNRLLAPAPLIEANVGLFPGTRNGLFALDLLLAVQLVPNERFTSEIRVDSSAARIGPVSLGLGFGARVGVLNERGALPSVAVSIVRRSVPRVGYGDVDAGDEIAADVDLRTTDLRLTAGKRFSVLTLAAGLGWSRYTGDAAAEYDVGIGPGEQGTIGVALDQTRMLYFLDAGVSLGFLKIVGEVGRQAGRDQQLTTVFDGYDDRKGTTFYSVGLRMGI